MRTRGRRRRPAQWRATACAALSLALGACSSFAPPQPWEKQDLARPSMQFDPDPALARATQHVYQSKEGATGGYGAGGGGCGCN